jgi:hypothetical protein
VPVPKKDSERSCLYQGRTVSGHPVPRKDSERSCIYVLGVSVLPLSVFFLVDFRTVSTVKHFFFIVLSITLLYRLDFFAFVCIIYPNVQLLEKKIIQNSIF